MVAVRGVFLFYSARLEIMTEAQATELIESVKVIAGMLCVLFILVGARWFK